MGLSPLVAPNRNSSHSTTHWCSSVLNVYSWKCTFLWLLVGFNWIFDSPVFVSTFLLTASTGWTFLLMSLLRNWGRNFTSPSRTHKALTAWINAGDECRERAAVTFAAVVRVKAKQQLDVCCYVDVRNKLCIRLLNLPAVWRRMKDSLTAFQFGSSDGASHHTWTKLDFKSGEMEVFNCSMCCNVYKSAFLIISFCVSCSEVYSLLFVLLKCLNIKRTWFCEITILQTLMWMWRKNI